MCGCYVEVVFNVEVTFNFVAKARHQPNLVPVLFSVLIYIPIYSFIFKNVFYYSCHYYSQGYSAIIFLSVVILVPNHTCGKGSAL